MRQVLELGRKSKGIEAVNLESLMDEARRYGEYEIGGILGQNVVSLKMRGELTGGDYINLRSHLDCLKENFQRVIQKAITLKGMYERGEL